MKLSQKTIAIFKNFNQINTNLLLQQGSLISTRSAKKTMAASVTVDEVFPSEFGIYDLNEFLGALMLFDTPVLEFHDKYINITEESNSSQRIRFYRAEKSVLIYQEKEIVFPEHQVQFTMPASLLTNIQRSAGVLRAEVVSVIGDSGQMMVQVGKQKQEANSYQNVIGTTDKTFKVDILIEHFKMIPGEYEVSIHPRIARFKSTTSDLVYYLAVETTSTFA